MNTKSERITVRLDPDTWVALQRLADAYNLPVSILVRSAIEALLSKTKEANKSSQ